MKHFFTYLLLLFSAFLFAAQTVSVSGKISHVEGNEILIGGFNFNLSVPVAPDGSFSKTFEIEHAGIYTLTANKSSLYLYLFGDIQLHIEADAEHLMTSVMVSGQNTQENVYLAQKAKIYAPVVSNAPAFYALEEAEFLDRVAALFAENSSLLAQSQNLKPEFRRLEAKQILHGIQPYYVNYKFMHSYYTKSNVPKAKATEAKLISYDAISVNEEEFFFSALFRGIKFDKFHKEFKQKSDKNPSQAKSLIEAAMAQEQNTAIRDFLLKNLSRDIKTQKGKDKYLFDAIIALSNDEKFKTELSGKMKTMGTFVNGSAAPSFTLPDQNGQDISLEDFKGKYVFIDFWATWCKPCIAEIPSLKIVEEKFKDKNIVFLSISVDTPKDTEKWKKFLNDKQIKGIQLIGDKGWESKISKDYLIQSIPRFVLIDTDGFLIDIDAPRPSEAKLTRMLNRLDKI